jgi:hypothetical protein
MRTRLASLSTALRILWLILASVSFGQSAARKVEIDGEKAKTLISILCSGNNALQEAIRLDGHSRPETFSMLIDRAVILIIAAKPSR